MTSALCLAGALVAGAIGGLLVVDRPGLSAEYYLASASWEGSPTYRGVAAPQVAGPEDLTRVLISRAICSVRWRGWLEVREAGRYGFAQVTGGGSYLRLGGELVVEAGPGRRRGRGELDLEPGLHRIEIGLQQAGQPTLLETSWRLPGAPADAPLAVEQLYPRRPAGLYRLLRRATGGLPVVARRLVGAALVLAALLLARAARRPLAPALARLGRSLRRLEGRRRNAVRAGFLIALFAASFLLALPFTAATVGGDDVRYLEAARFDERAHGYLNRYAHIYLLKAFIWLRGGDPFLGGRTCWAFLFAGTVTSLALAARSLGRGLQLGTLAVALFLLCAQTSLTGNIGAAFPDYTAMMLVTAGVALYLQSVSDWRRKRRHEWQALALGAITVAAFKSKETGLILAALPPLWLWGVGHVELKGFVRRLAYWAGGVLAAYLTLMTLDAWVLGDFLYSLRAENLAAVRETNFAADVLASRRGPGGWLDVVTTPRAGAHPADHALRNLGLLVVAAAAVAAGMGRRIERRLLHLLPLLFLLMMIALHVRATYIYSTRYLLPIVPVSCLLGAMLFHDLGGDGPWWKRMGSRRWLVPSFLAAAALVLVVNPLRLGELAAGDLLPAALLAELGWTPENLVASTLMPALLLLLIVAATLLLRRPETRPLLVVGCLLVFFGPGLSLTRQMLARHLSAQRGELLLYPWTAFRDELESARPRTLVVSPDLFRRYGMAGQPVVRQPLARLFFGSEHLLVWQAANPGADADFAVASRRDYQRWLRQTPQLADSARFDPSGLLVLVRPRAPPPEEQPAARGASAQSP